MSDNASKGAILLDDPALVASALEEYQVFHTAVSYQVILFEGPLWAAIEYVRAISPSNDAGGHYIVRAKP